MDALL